MAASSPPQPRTGIKEDVDRLKFERILNTATELFSKHGYTNCTMDNIAEAIGVTKPFIYYRFKDKSEILFAICSRGANVTHASIVAALEQEGSYTDRLASYCETFVKSVLELADFIIIYKREVSNLRPEDRKAIAETRRRTDELMQQLLTKGWEAGEFDPIEPAITASSITGMLSFVVDWYRPHLGFTHDQVVKTATQLALRMAGARNPEDR